MKSPPEQGCSIPSFLLRGPHTEESRLKETEGSRGEGSRRLLGLIVKKNAGIALIIENPIRLSIFLKEEGVKGINFLKAIEFRLFKLSEILWEKKNFRLDLLLTLRKRSHLL